MRTECDSLGEVQVPEEKLWGAQTQRALEHFHIGHERMPREMVAAYAVLKRAAAEANHSAGLLNEERFALIVQVCDELLAGRHAEMFPLNLWISGSGTQFNMNVNEVIANRSSQLVGEALGSKRPVHPNDHVNLSQSSNDTFPSAMHIACAQAVRGHLMPALAELERALGGKAREWQHIVKLGRTHLQDAIPLTLGQEFGGYAALLGDDLERLEHALVDLHELALGGTALGTGANSFAGFAEAAAASVARLTGLPFVSAPNKFAVMGSHDALVQLSATLRTTAVSLYKIASDIRLLACGPRAGFAELLLPENEPGSSIMPGKVNPTQAESLTMIAAQVMANDVAVGIGGAGGILEMNVYKPLLLHNVLQSVTLLAAGCTNFRRFLVEGMRPNLPRLRDNVERSLMLATALVPSIGYDRAAEIAHMAAARGLSIRQAALEMDALSAAELDRLLDPARMTAPEPRDNGAS
jgi:fumarate hydratase class II